MAKIVLTNAFISVDGVDLSDHFSSITINSSKDLVDVTGFGASAKENLLGLGDATITGTVFQDFAAASIDATLWPIHQAGSTCTVLVKPVDATVSSTNPSYTMTAVIPEYSPLDGQVGEASTTDITFQNAAQSGLVRATS